MNSNHELEEVHERLDRMEQKLNYLTEAQQVNRRSPVELLDWCRNCDCHRICFNDGHWHHTICK
ncbi:hypothetical protein B2I21_01290 [Chryseobacterium mucoviscidosis]|nr:hypothetical protein B2I21_01290 [Chryseobacterium mucoviscidosis]